MDCGTPGFPVHYQLLELAQTHGHRVGDATQSYPVIPFSSSLHSFPASGSSLMSQFFESSGQSIGDSASASVLPKNIQDWSPLGWTGWISLQSKGLSRVFSNTTVQKHLFFGTQLSHPYMTTGKTIALTRWTFFGKVMSLLFNMLSIKSYQMLEEVVIGWREVRWIWWMKQSFVAQFVQLLTRWLCNVWSGVGVEKNWAISVDQWWLQVLQFSVHLISLLSILLRCSGFAGIQKAVVDQTNSRPTNSDHGHFFSTSLVLWSAEEVQLFHVSNLLQMPNDHRMVDIEFFGNFLRSCKRSCFADCSQLVIVNFWRLATKLLIFKALNLLCKTSWSRAALYIC